MPLTKKLSAPKKVPMTRRTVPRWHTFAGVAILLLVVLMITLAWLRRGYTSPSAAAMLSPGPVDACANYPEFPAKQGFSGASLFSTAEPKVVGAILLQRDAEGRITRQYRHPSWDDAGYLGHTVRSRAGDVYVFPVPYVSVTENPPELQNRVYRIDSVSGEMALFADLPAAALPNGQNPFGAMGLAYDCEDDSLIATSVAGSTAGEEAGQIIRLDLATGQVRAAFTGVDAYGVGIYRFAEGKRLFYGSARRAEVYSLAVDDIGRLVGPPRLELTLPKAEERARRVIFESDGALQIRTYPFTYTLKVTSERPEARYRYRLNQADVWQLVADGEE